MDPNYQLTEPTLATNHDDSKLEKYIKDHITTTHHIQGTCRMAPDVNGGVVDAVGQVYGVSHLLVVDDSIAPFVSDGNTSAPAYFIGSTITDQLLGWEEMNDRQFGIGQW